MEKFLAFLKQPSTIRGIVGLLGAVGVVIAPDKIEAIAVGVGVIISAIELIRDEDKPKSVEHAAKGE